MRKTNTNIRAKDGQKYTENTVKKNEQSTKISGKNDKNQRMFSSFFIFFSFPAGGVQAYTP